MHGHYVRCASHREQALTVLYIIWLATLRGTVGIYVHVNIAGNALLVKAVYVIDLSGAPVSPLLPHTHTPIPITIYMYIYVCVCVLLYVEYK